jgi:uncharacterized protein (DUF2384 family)
MPKANTAINNDIFVTVPKVDYIQGLKNPQNVVQFLSLQKSDVSKATGQPKNSIRYDSRIPHELKKRIQEIGSIINLVAEHFEGDLEKTLLWFETDNPLLGDISPRDMIRLGRYQKLRKFVLNSISGEMP